MAVNIAPVYISANRKKPVAMLNCWAIHPSEKLIANCKMVARIANADCVRPMKCRGTIPISAD